MSRRISLLTWIAGVVALWALGFVQIGSAANTSGATFSKEVLLAYNLDTPLRLPAGSKLVVTAHYDNSRTGGREYQLLGVSVFNPSSHKAQKVAVKGIFINDINDANESRLNVTSLQAIGEACSE
jgi:hypothetical protein